MEFANSAPMATPSLILAVDPGYTTGWALVEFAPPASPRLVTIGTCRGEDAEPVLTLVLAGAEPRPRFAVVQVPCLPIERAAFCRPEGKMSLAKNALLSGQLAGLLRGAGLSVHMMLPRRGCRRPTVREWREFWHYTKRVSIHARDAAEFAFAEKKRLDIALGAR